MANRSFNGDERDKWGIVRWRVPQSLVQECPHFVQVKCSIDLSCLTPACSPDMNDVARKASVLPHLGQVSLTLGSSGSLSITSMGEETGGSMVLTSVPSSSIMCPHLEHTKPLLVARMYEPHFSQNFILPLRAC